MAAQTAQEDLAQFIQDSGLGTIGRNLFAGVEPGDQVDPVITLFGVGSEPPVRQYGPRRIIISSPRVRVWVRSKVYAQALALALQLYDLFQQTNRIINGRMYQRLLPLSEPMPLGPDSAGRLQIGFSVRTRRND